MKRIYLSLCALLLIYSSSAFAQTGTSFQAFFSQLPKPRPTIKETLLAYDMNAFEKAHAAASKEAANRLAAAYEPIFAQLAQNSREGQAKKTASQYSVEERTLLEAYQRHTGGLSEGAKSAYVQNLLAKRPLLGSGKLSWAVQAQKLTGADAGLYQQLLSLEKRFPWASFNDQALKQYYAFGDGDAAMKGLDDRFTADLAKLPKVKVELYDKVFVDVEEPSKAIALLQAYSSQKEKLFDSRYTALYKEWKNRHDTLAGICTALGEILDGRKAGTENNPVLRLVVADLSARAWQALVSLSYLTHRLMMDAYTASASGKQAAEMVAMYQQYKEKQQ